MMSLDRRYGHREPLEMYLTTYVSDRPTRGFTSNLSESGLYLNTLSHQLYPPSTPLGLEFELPGINETIWAAGEMCFEEPDDYFNGSGIRFLRMASLHERMLREYLREARRKRYARPRRLAA
jgi:hypothetical protein